MTQINGNKISKILAAIDGSDISMKAAEYAIAVAKLYNADLVALHVLPEDYQALQAPRSQRFECTSKKIGQTSKKIIPRKC